jgi:RNA polymerase sigma factor (sigma-70 family)
MAADPATLLRHLRRLAAPAPLPPDADAVLLGRFVRDRDEAAFAALVRRHGPMVQRVCRRALADPGLADDAFQATFLILARRAAAIRSRESLASWLHGVALRVARSAQATDARRRLREVSAPGLNPLDPRPDPLAEVSARELVAVVDEEVQRLPEAYRLPVILCCLEGRTREEAAALLGWTAGAVKGRLERGRARLHARLARRGLTLGTALAAVEVSRLAPAEVPAEGTVRAALAFAAGRGTAGTGVSPLVGRLAQEGSRNLTLLRMKVGLAWLLAASTVAAGAGALAHHVLARGQPANPDPPPAEAGRPQPNAAKPPRTDGYGDALPAGAVARLGTVRFRHGGDAQAVAFSPDGKTLAVRNWDAVLLYDAATGRQRSRLPVRTQFLMSRTLAFAPDGKTLAFESRVGTIVLWDLVNQKQRGTLAVSPTDRMTEGALAFSPDGKLLAALDEYDTVCLFDVATGRVFHRVGGGRKSQVNSLAFSPDGRSLALGSFHLDQIWDVATGKLVRSVEAHKGKFAFSLCFSPDGKLLASGSWDLITLVDAAGGKEVGRLEATGMESVNGLAFTPDGKRLLSSSQDGKLRVWDLAAKQARLTLASRSHVGRSLTLGPDGKTVAMGSACSTVSLWDLTTGKELFTEFRGHDDRVNAVAFTPDGKTLVSGGDDDQMRLWNTATWQQTRALPRGARDLSFTPDGRKLAAADTGNTVRIWDLPAGQAVLQVAVPKPCQLMGAALSSDGKALVSVDWLPPPPNTTLLGTSSLTVWDALTGKQLRRFTVAESWGYSLALAPGGRLAALNTRSGIVLYDLEAGREYATLRGPEGYIQFFTFTPDGRFVVSGSFDRTVRVWEVASGKEALCLRGHRRGVAAVAVSADGRLVASSPGRPRLFHDPSQADGPRRIRLWDLASGEEVASFEGHDWDLTALAFAPDGGRLASGFTDGTVLVWDTAPVQRSLRGRVRPLSAAELEECWAALAGEDAHQAQQAVWRLALDPERAVPWLRARVRPAAAVEPGKLAEWVAGLDSATFAERETASRELAALGDEAAPALREALRGKPTPEMRRRAEALLERLRGPVTLPEALRSVRAVAVLEDVATPPARQLLEEVAGGAPGARLTRGAKASLERLARRPARAP